MNLTKPSIIMSVILSSFILVPSALYAAEESGCDDSELSVDNQSSQPITAKVTPNKDSGMVNNSLSSASSTLSTKSTETFNIDSADKSNGGANGTIVLSNNGYTFSYTYHFRRTFEPLGRQGCTTSQSSIDTQSKGGLVVTVTRSDKKIVYTVKDAAKN